MMDIASLLRNGARNAATENYYSHPIYNKIPNQHNSGKMTVWNETAPSSTVHKDLGIDGLVHSGFWFMPTDISKGNFRLIIHKPFEMPDDEPKQYSLEVGKSMMFAITPQLKKMDESLFKLTPKE